MTFAYAYLFCSGDGWKKIVIIITIIAHGYCYTVWLMIIYSLIVRTITKRKRGPWLKLPTPYRHLKNRSTVADEGFGNKPFLKTRKTRKYSTGDFRKKKKKLTDVNARKCFTNVRRLMRERYFSFLLWSEPRGPNQARSQDLFFWGGVQA